MSEVSFRGIEKRFDAQSLALVSLDLDVPDGAFLVLLGPSGCGKTTALRVLAGLELPTAGSVHIGGRDVTQMQPRDRDVAMVFQSYALYPHMTVAENIGYPLRIRGLSKKEQRASVERVADSLEIQHLLDRRPRHLSGGQRQRVALARAIVREPSVFLMDEPLSNLDAKLRTSMRGEIKRLQKRLGTTTLYVTHDQAEAMTMADLVAVMREGELQQLAPPDEIYDRPANRFVAAFVGNPPMNVLDGKLSDDGRSFLLGDQPVAVGAELGAELKSAGASALGVRPEDLEILPQGAPGALAGEIYVVEPMGNETLVDVRIGDQRVMARAAREFAAPIGSPIGVRVALESTCFFGPGGNDGAPPERPCKQAKGDVRMTPEMPSEGSTPSKDGALSRRDLLRTSAAAGAGLAAVPLLGATPAYASTRRRSASKKLVMGAFVDPALVPFKQKIIPLFKKETGISIEMLQAPYDAFFAKAFQDGQSKAGQYDIYIMDDPWVPQYASAGILEDLSSHGIVGDAGFAKPFIDLGYWPPRSGPRVKGFETKKPTLVALPTIGDLQTLTYRNDVYSHAPKTWHELVTVGQKAMKDGKIKYAYVMRGVKGNPIVTSWYPIFLSWGGQFFDNKWKVTFNSPQGKASADFYVGKLKSLAPPGVAEYDSTQEGAAILGGDAGAIIQYTGNAISSDDPKVSKEVGKLDFSTVPKQVKAIAQIGIFIHGVSASAPNKDNAITFMKWFATDKAQLALALAGDVPVRTNPLKNATAVKKHRLLPTVLAQLNSGAQARPRMPDWSAVELILGTELNKALVAGKGGGAALDRAATQATAYLKRQGYYS